MWRRSLLLCGLTALTFGCGMVDRLVHRSGHLRLDRVGQGPRLVLDVPVEALLCEADTTLSIVGSDGSWSAAIALRTAWPATAHEFAIDSIVRGLGSAALSARPLGDSVGDALTALRGSLRLTGGARVAGSVDLVAASPRDTVRLVGSFDVPAVATGGCPAP